MGAAVGWLVTMLVNDAKQWGWAKLKEIRRGSPLEAALTAVTSAALSRAVAATLGSAATAENQARMTEVLDQVWPRIEPVLRDPSLYPSVVRPPTLLDRLRSSIAAAMKVATTPMLDLSSEFEPPASLALLADELGVTIDEDAFTDTLVATWVAQVRATALTNAAIKPVEDQLEAASIMELVSSVQSALGAELKRSVQVLSEQIAQQGSVVPTTERWFEAHVVPIDLQLEAIYSDYQQAFLEAADGLVSNEAVEALIPKLYAFRRRALSSRINVNALTIALQRTQLDDVLAAAVVSYARGVADFLHGGDPDRAKTWFSAYAEEFADLVDAGRNPHDREQYKRIELPPDPIGAIRSSLRYAADELLPKSFADYRVRYHELRLVCIPAGPGPGE